MIHITYIFTTTFLMSHRMIPLKIIPLLIFRNTICKSQDEVCDSLYELLSYVLQNMA